ncbi:hypothetical protein UB35_19870 [Photobacterium angustum]|nr:hypothetical protein UB35_19870 [Photobacterium angustum]PSV61670.1 hypothetical protein CTM95_20425 [Photobacterium angustum]
MYLAILMLASFLSGGNKMPEAKSIFIICTTYLLTIWTYIGAKAYGIDVDPLIDMVILLLQR